MATFESKIIRIDENLWFSFSYVVAAYEKYIKNPEDGGEAYDTYQRKVSSTIAGYGQEEFDLCNRIFTAILLFKKENLEKIWMSLEKVFHGFLYEPWDKNNELSQRLFLVHQKELNEKINEAISFIEQNS